ncbi:ArsC/Spx/MgsR family protein [Ectobacillus ponti]|uniref:Spx/MgsR family RNA polymerase-binding regulatory protein n=1 Tax=Ectobacillus ponti TaxID=2961894 RepID=A0AA42BS67_9BACI|nr:ArsC/Spx/MgsR family protein [Ectobacillus ponti]MCP8971066.1 hypothetical protein [Ectobacillus ponti]
MDHWILYGRVGNPSYEITKAWLVNNGIPFENRSVFQLTQEDITMLAAVVPGGVKELVYPDTFSFSLINPQKHAEKQYVTEIQSGKLSETEALETLGYHPALLLTPILTNGKQVIVGYDLDTLVNTFRFVKVKDVTLA